MKKIWFLILFLVILGNVFLFPYKTTAQMNGIAILTVNKSSVEVGEMISGKATITLFESFAATFHISFGDGSSSVYFDCPFNSDAPSGITTCEQNFVHVYDTPRTYIVSLNSHSTTGGFGGGVIDTLSSEDIAVAARPTSTIATSIQPALLATSTGEIIRSIIGVVYWIVGSLMVLLIMIGGFTIMTAAGDPKRVTKGKQIIVYAIIGFAIMAISRGILVLIYLILGINIP